ncbi:MAG: hypothetical protein NWF01_06030 [Candidatus Bathyarchaeota archaeon]|nr:hypothetical protein [Candidatus Bathyarchaeota archaeon]
MTNGKTIFWLTLFFATITGVTVAVAANPAQNLAIWAALLPLVFIIVAFSAEIFVLEALKNTAK